MTSVILVAVVLGAVALGLAARRLVGRWQPDDVGPSLPDVLGHALSLAVLFLAFVLVENAQAFSRAREAANAEADRVDQMFELAGYGPASFREAIQGDLVCYARAIRQHEWRVAEKGEFAPEVSVWANAMRRPVGELLTQESTLFEMIVDADKERASQHQSRVLEAGGTMPGAVYALVAVILLVSIAGFAASLPRRNNRLHIIAVALLSLLLVATLLLIQDLERPFNGFVKLDPVAMRLISTELESEFDETFGMRRLPCDDSGETRTTPGEIGV